MKTNYFGVTYEPARKKYKASIWHNRKNIFIGRFNNPIEAAQAYDKKAKELRGIFTPLNFSDYSRATKFQLECYKLCSPDFHGLFQWQTAKLLETDQSCVCEALKKLKKKCPELFPIKQPLGRMQRYESWMDDKVVIKI